MTSSLISRRTLAIRLAVLPLGVGAAVRFVRASADASEPPGTGSDGLSHATESIHQEVTFQAAPGQVYAALTSARRFDALTRLSDAATLVTAPNAKATTISREVGGAFVLFGGYITGRHLEMVPGERLVQAWRAGSWPAGDYSVVKFALAAQDSGCRLIFDHGGFPEGQGASLAYGWRVHYWEPLAKLLAQR